MKILFHQQNNKLLALIFISAFLFSCDFTPRLHKKILEAQEYIKKQEYSKAISQYQEILKNNPPADIKVKINYQLGELFSINLGKNRQSIKYYKDIKNLTESPLWLVKSEERIAEVSFTYLKDYKLSEKSYRLLVNFTPRLEKYDFYQFRLATTYIKSNQYNMALKELDKIQKVKSHKFYVDSYFQIGLLNFQKKNNQEAIDNWKEYLKRETRKSKLVQTRFLMANAYESMEKLKQAYNLYYSILGEYPNTEVIQNRLNSIFQRRVSRKR
jgi:tetratricopeptide (TPR) repeat protein